MPNSDNDGGSSLNSMEVWDGALHDERKIEIQDSTIVVTHRISATSPKAVQFQLIDPVPGQFDIDKIGFHPDYEPDHGWLLIDEAVISGVVTPDDPVVVKYGLRPDGKPHPDMAQRLQAAAKPSIELSIPVEDTEAAAADLETAMMRRSSKSSEPVEPETSEFVAEIDRRIRETEKQAETFPTADDNADRDKGDPLGDSVPAEDSKPVKESEGDESSGLDDPDRAGEPDPSRPGPGWGGDPFGDREWDAAIATSAAEAPDENSQAEGEDGRSGHSRKSFVETLLNEFERGDITDNQRERLGERFRDIIPEQEPSDRTTKVRLQHLESEMQRFSAYANALEDIIQTHGSGEEYLSSIHREIESLEASFEDLDTKIDRAYSSRRSQRLQMNKLAEKLEKLNSRLSGLRESVESLQEIHREERMEFGTQVNQDVSATEHIDELETELQEVRMTVGKVEAKLTSLRSALSEGLD